MEIRNEGQSAIEFLMSFIVIFTMVISFYKLAVNYTNGYLVHYATYMASRAYLVFDDNSNNVSQADGQAEVISREVFNSFKLPVLIPNFNGVLTFNTPEYPGNKLYVGAVVNYSIPFSVQKMFGGKDPVNLTSESFLGREPTRAECGVRVCSALKQVPSGTCDNNSTFFDNGC